MDELRYTELAIRDAELLLRSSSNKRRAPVTRTTHEGVCGRGEPSRF